MALDIPHSLAVLAEKPECSFVFREWVRLTKREGCFYDEASADAAVKFFPDFLRLTDGEWAGRPFLLSSWQECIIRLTFGLKRTDGFRAIGRVLLWVPRKNGKTEMLAGVSLLALLGDGEFGGQGFIIASDKEQATIAFEKARSMIRMSPGLSDHLESYVDVIFAPEIQAKFKPLSGRADGKHGLSASYIGGDEMHEWRDDRLYTFLNQSTGARRQPLEFLISTAGVKGIGFGYDLWRESIRIADDTVEDLSTLVVIFAADPQDDWQNEETWKKANPNIGVSPKWEYMRKAAAKAHQTPRLENHFRRYHLNQWTEQSVRWMSIETWDKCAKSDWRNIDDLAHRTCFAGLDLSSTSDITSLVLVFPPTDEDDSWRVVVRFWVPADSIELRARRDNVRYDEWQKIGAIEATEGNVVDYKSVEAAVFDAFERYDVRLLGCDPYNATRSIQEFQEHLGEERIKMIRQGFLSISAPTKELEKLVLEGKLDHGNHPVLRWMAQNVAVTQDAAGNIKPAKDKSTEKIDGIAALINALGASMVPGVQSSYLEQAELVVA